MEILSSIFGNEIKVKLMRLFLFNPDTPYTISQISEKSKSLKKSVNKEISMLTKIGLIRKKAFMRDVQYKKRKKIIIKKVNDKGYILDQKFPYLNALKDLLIMVSLHADDSLVRKFNSIGKIRLFIVSGLFIQNWNSRVDMLIAGDNININRLNTVIKNIEAEIGKEIAYSAFETDDFEYRLGIHDRLIRDILDFPHHTLVDKLGLSEK